MSLSYNNNDNLNDLSCSMSYYDNNNANSNNNIQRYMNVNAPMIKSVRIED